MIVHGNNIFHVDIGSLPFTPNFSRNVIVCLDLNVASEAYIILFDKYILFALVDYSVRIFVAQKQQMLRNGKRAGYEK